jgi:hypothetical protein
VNNNKKKEKKMQKNPCYAEPCQADLSMNAAIEGFHPNYHEFLATFLAPSLIRRLKFRILNTRIDGRQFSLNEKSDAMDHLLGQQANEYVEYKRGRRIRCIKVPSKVKTVVRYRRCSERLLAQQRQHSKSRILRRLR